MPRCPRVTAYPRVDAFAEKDATMTGDSKERHGTQRDQDLGRRRRPQHPRRVRLAQAGDRVAHGCDSKDRNGPRQREEPRHGGPLSPARRKRRRDGRGNGQQGHGFGRGRSRLHLGPPRTGVELPRPRDERGPEIEAPQLATRPTREQPKGRCLVDDLRRAEQRAPRIPREVDRKRGALTCLSAVYSRWQCHTSRFTGR
jgi:hypothetical protein